MLVPATAGEKEGRKRKRGLAGKRGITLKGCGEGRVGNGKNTKKKRTAET